MSAWRPYSNLGIIALNGSKKMGELVDRYILERNNIMEEDSSYLIDIQQIRFSNGEGKLQIMETVRGKDIYILADIGNYSCTYELYGHQNHMGPDEHFADIKRVLSAIDGKAQRVSVVMPLLYGSRQHRRKTRESLDCAIALQELEKLGVDCIFSFDVHDPNVQNAIPLLSFENIYPTADIVEVMVEDEEKLGGEFNKDSMIIISPDTGAMDRAIHYSNVLGLDIGLFYKRRDYTRVVNGKNPIVEHKYIGRDVDGMDILIVDDMIASGESVLDIAKELKEHGAKRVFCAVSFALFTEGIEKFHAYYESGHLDSVYTTNLSYVPQEYQAMPWLKVVDCSSLMGNFIWHINRDKSVSRLLDKTRGIKPKSI